MSDMHTATIQDASAWTPADLENDRGWRLNLDDLQRAELVDALANARKQGLAFADMTPQRFPLPRCAPVTAAHHKRVDSRATGSLLPGSPRSS